MFFHDVSVAEYLLDGGGFVVRDEFHRQVFADFLNRLASGVEGEDEWFDLVVAHYQDEELEETRRQLVRLSIQRNTWGIPVWQDSDRKQIECWARQLLDVETA